MAATKEIIAFQGVPGAHSDLACRQAHPYMDTLACTSFEEVFEVVLSGKATYGMLPIENSQAGRVAEIHNLLPRFDIHVVGEYFLKVEHHLLGCKGATIDSIKDVYSHPQALMQCRKHILEMGLTMHHASNTAIAAEEVAGWNDPSKGALASELAAELYGLTVIKPHMEDSSTNTTVFVTIAKDAADPDPRKGPVLTSLVFTARNIPAALYKALGGFATNQVNLLKLESYIPGGVSSTAQFFVTFEGHPTERNVQLAIEELGFFCKDVKLLGVYPAASERYS